MLLFAEIETAVTSASSGESIFTIWFVFLLGAGALTGAFLRMSGAWGASQVRTLGLVLVASFAALLAVHDRSTVAAAFGVLGAIAGYLLGAQDRDRTPPPSSAP